MQGVARPGFIDARGTDGTLEELSLLHTEALDWLCHRFFFALTLNLTAEDDLVMTYIYGVGMKYGYVYTLFMTMVTDMAMLWICTTHLRFRKVFVEEDVVACKEGSCEWWPGKG